VSVHLLTCIHTFRRRRHHHPHVRSCSCDKSILSTRRLVWASKGVGPFAFLFVQFVRYFGVHFNGTTRNTFTCRRPCRVVRLRAFNAISLRMANQPNTLNCSMQQPNRFFFSFLMQKSPNNDSFNAGLFSRSPVDHFQTFFSIF
jgi:hypothetical protein